jgi:hypothetical protein
LCVGNEAYVDIGYRMLECHACPRKVVHRHLCCTCARYVGQTGLVRYLNDWSSITMRAEDRSVAVITADAAHRDEADRA